MVWTPTPFIHAGPTRAEAKMKTRFGVPLVLAVMLLLTVSCVDNDTSSPTEIVTSRSLADGAELFETSPGVLLTAVQANAILSQLANDLAIALGRNDELRMYVHDAIANSPYTEGKLDFSAEIEKSSNGLLRQLAEVRQQEDATVLATVDSLMKLELYLPVLAHREAWRGGSDLLIASLISDDGDFEISAFSLDGRSMPVSQAAPPSTPTLALVPAETNFEEKPSSDAIAFDYGEDLGSTW